MPTLRSVTRATASGSRDRRALLHQERVVQVFRLRSGLAQHGHDLGAVVGLVEENLSH
jgi:hypothetical protein